ncbi:MAG: class IV adenylate cyclase [Gemmatimonadota bacterium]|nr:class IV adenylate cyclase [Gemmatimonadota bacterium]
MREVELKSVVDDLRLRCQAVERHGATRVFAGQLEDRRYDTPDRSLAARDHVLRVRIYRDAVLTRAELDFKGPTSLEGGYKVREELGTQLTDADAIVAMLDRLGYEVTVTIDRDIVQYDLDGAMIRFETYPRMDDLVEVEGLPEQIEHAIAALGLPRAGFVADRLSDFARRFEERTGEPAAVSNAALAAGARYESANG